MDTKEDHNGLTSHPSEIHDLENIQHGTSKNLGSLDDEILRAQGHEAVLQRSFSLISSIGLAFDITNSWVGALSNFGQSLRYGGSQVALLSVIVACFVQWIITLGLSELASAFPSSGGQYHFVYIVAPERSRRFGAFATGWMSILGWWIGTCSGLSLVSTSILGLASFLHPEFVVKQWHEYCVYLGTITITMLPLIFCPQRMPQIASWSLFLTLSGFACWFVVILSMHDHTNNAEEIFRSGQGTSGWSAGTGWMLGIVNSMYCFTGTDGAIHIAEEMRSPGKRLPKIMNMTMAIGLVTAGPMIAAMMVVMQDMDKVMNSGMPAVELLYEATGSKPATIALSVLLIIIYCSNIPPQWLTSGRIAWAFARDGGVPFSNFFTKVNTRLEFPLRTTVATNVFAAIYGLLYLASTTAFNSIITSAILALNLSYAIPQAILVFRGRKRCLPERPLNLCSWGYIYNVFALLWIMLMIILVCFPPALPVTVASMNYSAVTLVGLFLIIIGFWFSIGRSFEGPHINWEMLNLGNQTNLTASTFESTPHAHTNEF